MAARLNLRQLADSNQLNFLQDKVDRLHSSYNLNTNEENVAKCSELVELNGKVQRELVKILDEIAAEGGYSARSVLRSKYYPYFYDDTYLSSSRAAALLSSSRFGSSYLYGSAHGLGYDFAHFHAVMARKNAEIDELNARYENNISDLEEQLRDSKAEISGLKKELDSQKEQLSAEVTRAGLEKLSLEAEINRGNSERQNLKADLESAKQHLSAEIQRAASEKSSREAEVGEIFMRGDCERLSLKQELDAKKEQLLSEINKASFEKLNLEAEINRGKSERFNLEAEIRELKSKLDLSMEDMVSEKNKANSEKYLLENDINDLKAKINHLEVKIAGYEPRVALVDDYERQILFLKDEIRILKTTNSILIGSSDFAAHTASVLGRTARAFSPLRSSRARSPAPARSRSKSKSRSRPSSPTKVSDSVRQDNLVSKFNLMFSKDRLDALDILKVYCDDHENNQRILYAVMQEAVSVAKTVFAESKVRVRANLGESDCLEDAIQDYIYRNLDLYDLPLMVSKVIGNMNFNSKIYLPVGVGYSVINSFIREACRLAWQMASLPNPLDLSTGSDADVFDESRYKRSFDSEFTAPLVSYHIWPCLLQDGQVVVKGEACTKRDPALHWSIRKRNLYGRSYSPIGRYSSMYFTPYKYHY